VRVEVPFVCKVCVGWRNLQGWRIEEDCVVQDFSRTSESVVSCEQCDIV